ncbi:ATP-binding SpoIIE family protein phosphatase [Streptomyces flaveolus]|uniref:ATP-binding SpoIIE family protein phosphatase n=1 Tax=Streptomyces flaveolus TaxID=67297 RepID=UPI0036FDD1D2
MRTDVDAFLRDIALRLRPRVGELVAPLVTSMREQVPSVWAHHDLTDLATDAAHQHIDTVLQSLERGAVLSGVQAPPAAIDFARRLAECGGQITELLRAYRIGHATALAMVQREAALLVTDPQLRDAAAARLTAVSFDYIDHTSEQAVMAFQRARDDRLQKRLMVVNEASQRIGTSLDIGRTAQELAEVGTAHLADFVTVDLLESTLHEEDAAPAHDSLTVRRIAQHPPDGCPQGVPIGHTHSFTTGSDPAKALAAGQITRHTITSDDIPAWLTDSDTFKRHLGDFGTHTVLLAPLWARGSPLGVAQFFRHRDAAPFEDDDLLLAQEVTSRAAVYIDNARMYTHERDTALALQQSLLPDRVPRRGVVETAARYLPASTGAGVGGDWYDVIPLSGARTALVIGDVVGRGLYAAATMGRLRTAVRTLADIDLMPDELLTHLDDVVIRLQREEGRDLDEFSATCLYAVYDPVTRMCSLASAGHAPPAVTLSMPGSSRAHSPQAHFVDAPIGPPLGLGGLPFETIQFELPEGSLLALFTDGLIESATRDLAIGMTQLLEVLGDAGPSLEDVCDRLVSTLLPSRSADDVALLLARTRALDAGHVSTLNLPSDPSAVAQARTYATDQLAAWNLDALAFSTELIISELVTNAIRYGREPISLRLILQSTLTCEVADAASTAPRLRRARTFEEGGRGLFLVAQLAANWGTRYTRDGKVIWAEQLLPGSSPAGTT